MSVFAAEKGDMIISANYWLSFSYANNDKHRFAANNSKTAPARMQRWATYHFKGASLPLFNKKGATFQLLKIKKEHAQ